MVADRREDQLALVHILAPRMLERVRRLEFALRHVRAGTPPAEIRTLLRLTYGVSWPTAWRTVDIAIDLAGPV